MTRTRRLLKWCGTTLCVLILGVAVLSFRWQYCGLMGYSVTLYARGGSIEAYWVGRFPHLFAWPEWESSVPLNHWPEWKYAWSQQPTWPTLTHPSRGESLLTIPLWLPFVLIAIPTALLSWLDRRRVVTGKCRKCAYDLTGNTSGVCPECGTPTGVSVTP